jgi:hypothetical protein
MTPQEKAVDLVDKFYQHTNTNSKERAKACALIAVDEILKARLSEPEPEWLDWSGTVESYWLEVRQEIEKL